MNSINLILARFKTDIIIVLVVLLCAIIIRAPHFDYPEEQVLDEGFFVWYTTNTSYGTPFFEPHPPLSWMIFSAVVPEINGADGPDKYLNSVSTRQSFDVFPYKKIRLLNVFVGTLLPVVVYGIGRLGGFGIRFSLLASLLVVLDNALIIYSRLMLPDGLLLLFGLMSVAAALTSKKVKSFLAIPLVLSTGLFAGLAVSVKWTAFGFVLASVFILLWPRLNYSLDTPRFLTRLAFVALFTVTVLVTYFGVFAYFFSHMKSGSFDISRSFFKTEVVKNLSFPGLSPLNERFEAVGEYSRIFYKTHSNPPVAITSGANRGSPIRWPLDMAPIQMWGSAYGSFFIVLLGNPFTWPLGFSSVLVCVWALIRSLRKKQGTGVENGLLIFLVVSYCISYIPFLFVSRPLFVYGYFPALIFSYLSVPAALFLLRPILLRSLGDADIIDRVVFFLILTLAAISFLVVSPMTYGF